jgi:hypothetical protein
MPRGRGAGGVAVYDGKIYYAGGLHDGKAVAWVDVYDPATDTWAQLPDMPRVRDHFHAAVVDGKFYAIAGRDSVVNATTTKVDTYDLANGAGGTWQNLDTALPTARGGFATAVLGDEILVIGGEGGGKAYNNVEAYDTVSNTWRTLEPMPTARHGIQAAVCNDGVYIAAGGMAQGGSSPTNRHEVLSLNGATSCESPGDTSPPVVKEPTQTLTTGATLGTASSTTPTLPAKISWSATDSDGIAAYELQQSENGGAWTNVSLSSATTTTAKAQLQAGKTYSFQVRAKDQKGLWSEWKPGPTFKVNVLQETASAIGYTGTSWSTQSLSNASGGALKYASTSGNSAKLNPSRALSVAWVSPKSTDRGKAEAWVDGTKKDVDLYYSGGTQMRRVVFSKNQLDPAVSHELEVRVLGTKSASSSGTRADVDAFVVLEEVP